MKKFVIFIILVCVTLSACACKQSLYSVDFTINEKTEKTFYSDPGGSVSEYTPNRELGYSFIGWYAPDDTLFDFSAPLSGSIVLRGKFLDFATNTETFDIKPPLEILIRNDTGKYEDIGEVVLAAKNERGYYLISRGYYGYHLDQNPYMEIGLFITPDGKITHAEKLGEKNQSEGFADFITAEYLASTYGGKNATTDFDLNPATGATATSKAVQYAVFAAANYLKKVHGVSPDTNDAEKAELNAVFAAEYKTIESDYSVNKNIGTVVYAAEGAKDGKNVVALKVKGSRIVIANGASYQGWDSQIPNAYTMIIVIDKATNKIIAYSVVTDGTRRTEYFTVPESAHLAYQNVEISAATAFDTFDGGLVHPDYNTSDLYDGNLLIGEVITGTSILFTGATTDGTFSSQLVRNCYRTAAYFYANYK